MDCFTVHRIVVSFPRSIFFLFCLVDSLVAEGINAAASTVGAPQSVSFGHNQSKIGTNVDLESRETRPAFIKAAFYTVNTSPDIYNQLRVLVSFHSLTGRKKGSLLRLY